MFLINKNKLSNRGNGYKVLQILKTAIVLSAVSVWQLLCIYNVPSRTFSSRSLIIVFCFFLQQFLFTGVISAQINLSTLRVKKLALCTDTTKIDSLSISPSDIYITINNKPIRNNEIMLNNMEGFFIKNDKKLSCSDTIFISYRILPTNLSLPLFHKNPTLI